MVGVCVGVFVGVPVGVFVGVLVGVLVGVAVGVFVGVLVGVVVGVAVGVLVGVAVGVFVAAEHPHPKSRQHQFPRQPGSAAASSTHHIPDSAGHSVVGQSACASRVKLANRRRTQTTCTAAR